MTRDSSLSPMCDARSYLSSELADKAISFETSTIAPAIGADVERVLRCTLQEHGQASAHHALVLELDGMDSGAVWARWDDGGQPELVRLPDCPGQGVRPCNEYAGHPGGHSFQIQDRWAPWQDGLSHPPV